MTQSITLGPGCSSEKGISSTSILILVTPGVSSANKINLSAAWPGTAAAHKIPQTANGRDSSYDIPHTSASFLASFDSNDEGSVSGQDDILLAFDDHAEGEVEPIGLKLHDSLLGVKLLQDFIFGDIEVSLQEG